MPVSRDVTRRAAAEPDRPAVVGPCGRLSFGDVARRAEVRAESLALAGVEAGHSVTVDDDNPVDVIVGLLAADLLSAVAIVADPTWPPEVSGDAVQAATKALESSGDAASLVVFTSGSTGTPRPVVRSRRSWTLSFPTFSALTGIGAADTVLIPGRLSGSLFLFGALHAVTMGATIHPLPHWSPDLAADAAETCTVAHVVPPMLAALVERRRAPGDTRLRLAVCGGARLDPGADEAAREVGVEVIDYYGAAELSFVAIRRAGAPTGRLRAFPDVDVDVRDRVVWARSPYLAAGLERDPDGFATVGDRGELHDDGTLTVYGRGSGAITSGGSTVEPDGVEQVLRRLPGVTDVAVVGTPHAHLGEVVVAVVEADRDAVSLTSLRAGAAAGLVPAQRPRLWYVVDRLPRTGSGKVARARLVDGLADGTLGVRSLR